MTGASKCQSARQAQLGCASYCYLISHHTSTGHLCIVIYHSAVAHQAKHQQGHSTLCRLCTTLIRVCAQHGQCATALSLYDWMRSSPSAGGAGLNPTVYTYTAAMRAALSGNALDRALTVWQDASTSGCATDCRLATTYIEVCAKRGDTQQALLMYSQMRSAAPHSRMAPSVHAYTAAMRAAAEGGMWMSALEIWADMERAGCKPTGDWHEHVLAVCSSSNLLNLHVRLFRIWLHLVGCFESWWVVVRV